MYLKISLAVVIVISGLTSVEAVCDSSAMKAVASKISKCTITSDNCTSYRTYLACYTHAITGDCASEHTLTTSVSAFKNIIAQKCSGSASSTNTVCDSSAMTAVASKISKCTAPTDVTSSDYCTSYRTFLACYTHAIAGDCASEPSLTTAIAAAKNIIAQKCLKSVSSTNTVCDSSAMAAVASKISKCTAPTDVTSSNYCTSYRTFLACFTHAIAGDCASEPSMTTAVAAFKHVIAQKCSGSVSSTNTVCDSSAMTAVASKISKCTAPTDVTSSNYCTSYRTFLTCFTHAIAGVCASEPSMTTSIAAMKKIIAQKCPESTSSSKSACDTPAMMAVVSKISKCTVPTDVTSSHYCASYRTYLTCFTNVIAGDCSTEPSIASALAAVNKAIAQNCPESDGEINVGCDSVAAANKAAKCRVPTDPKSISFCEMFVTYIYCLENAYSDKCLDEVPFTTMVSSAISSFDQYCAGGN